MFQYRSLCVESEPLGSVLNYDYVLKVIMINDKIACVVVVIDCDRNQFGAGLKLGEGFGRDIRKTGETLPNFWLEYLIRDKIKSETDQFKGVISHLIQSNKRPDSLD